VAKIAVVNAPFYSHADAATRLTRVIARQGHDVVAWGPEAFREQIEQCGARFELHDPPIDDDGDGLGIVAGMVVLTESLTGELIEQLHGHQVDLIIYDTRVLWAHVAGEYLGIPRVASHPMFPIVAEGRIGPDRQWIGSSVGPPEGRERYAQGWLSIARRWSVEIEDESSVIHSRADDTFAFTTEKIVGRLGLRPGWHYVGPLMAPAPPAERPVERPLVYVCFGTAYNFRAELFRAVIDALGGQPLDVLISTGGGPVKQADLEPLPENVEVREFVPAREVLARASVHITHGGCNSVHESLLAAVPMVCVPQAYDQFPFGWRLEQLGVGLKVTEDVWEIRDAVRLLLTSPKAQARARDLSDHLLQHDGEARVAAAIDEVLAANSVAAG